MRRTRNEPFPGEPVRDLLGIARALYLSWKRNSATETPLMVELREVGEELKACLELGTRCPVPSLGHAAAWDRANAATERLCRIIGTTTTMLPAAEAMRQRVANGPPPPTSRSEERKGRPRR